MIISEKEDFTMDPWMIVVFVTLCFLVKLLLSKLNNNNNNNKSKLHLPPGPPTVLLLAKLLWLRRSLFDIKLDIVRQLHARYGPIITLSGPTILLADRHLAHQAIVQKGAALSDRHSPPDPARLITSNQHTIGFSRYGPLWRLLRRNLTANALHPSRVTQFAPARKWALRLLLDKLKAKASSPAKASATVPAEAFNYSMLSLLVFMCFGEKPDESVIRRIEAAQLVLHRSIVRFNVFKFFPLVTKIMFRRRWTEIVEARKELEEVFFSLAAVKTRGYGYFDSLGELDLPDGRKLTRDETSSLCLEFLRAGKDTTISVLQWIMANLVRRPDIQCRLAEEIELVMDSEAEVVEEADIAKMPYLRAVVMEGLRRHPPGYFIMPHTASEDAEVGGYLVPKGAMVVIEAAEVNWDGEVWGEEPMEFRPERFLDGGPGEAMDMTGSREIKMMTFGAGRRICPAFGLAILHLQYFVANLVREFEWKAVEGEEIDMRAKMGFVVGMEKPLRAQIIPRRNK